MKRFMISVAAGALSTTAAFAASDIATLDANGDGFADMAEVMAVYPGFAEVDFETIDTNDDDRLSSDEILTGEAQEIFNRSDASLNGIVRADANQDGFITFEEMMAVAPEFSRTDFDSIDTNSDNRISTAEIRDPEAVAILDRQPSLQQGGVMSGTMDFASLDVDGDEFLTYAELAVGYPNVPQDAFDDLDENDDGRLSSEEFNAPEASAELNSY